MNIHVEGAGIWGNFGAAGDFKGECRDGVWQVHWFRTDLQCGGIAELYLQPEGNELLVHWAIDSSNSTGGLGGKGIWRFRRADAPSPSQTDLRN